MHSETLRKTTHQCLALLGRQKWLRPFYLAGGTALTLHLGHRISDDLDFFSKEEVDPKKLRLLLASLGPLKVEMEREGTLWAKLRGTRVSFFQYPYPLIDRLKKFEGTAIAGIKDIAGMKLDSISSRGSRKDFVDLYFILKSGHSLPELLAWYRRKFSGIDFNQAHLLKSLTYFEDADREPHPRMLRGAGWVEIKRFLALKAEKLVI